MENEIKEIRQDVKTLIQSQARVEEKFKAHSEELKGYAKDLKDHMRIVEPIITNHVWKRESLKKLGSVTLLGSVIGFVVAFINWWKQ